MFCCVRFERGLMFCVLDAGICIDGCNTEVDGMSCIVAQCYVACVFMLHLYSVFLYFVGVAGRASCVRVRQQHVCAICLYCCVLNLNAHARGGPPPCKFVALWV